MKGIGRQNNSTFSKDVDPDTPKDPDLFIYYFFSSDTSTFSDPKQVL